jgi:cell migration-inducing and hyaluronan-binding protein
MGATMNGYEPYRHGCKLGGWARVSRMGSGLIAAGLLLLGAQAAEAAEYECGNGDLAALQPPDIRDLKVTGRCSVQINRKSYFGNVNIVDGGVLLFRESNGPGNSQTDFWASSIIIEKGGAMIADGAATRVLPYGVNGGTLTIHLYGKNEAVWNPVTERFDAQNAGAVCKSGPVDRSGRPQGPCGVDKDIWDSNGSKVVVLPISDDKNVPIADYFYQYGPLYGDGRCSDGSVFDKGRCANAQAQVGYFGNKVLAVSFGGQLELDGYKGATTSAESNQESDPTYSGWSWMRLDRSLAKDDTRLLVERDLYRPEILSTKWKAGDEIVVTTTDYMPGHSEKLKVTGVDNTYDPQHSGYYVVDFEAVDRKDGRPGVRWPHNGGRFGGYRDGPGKRWSERLPDRLTQKNDPEAARLDPELVNRGAETRAAVALLTRSIQIVSAGDRVNENFPVETTGYSYGAHMVVRQGAWRVQVQGVEFRQMGQGGRLAHYPVHFHMARKTAGGTYIKDSSINESMTRWIVLHSTQGVTLARNVGYKSIGHGFYLEDGTETDNNLYSNIGIFARAAVQNVQNPRKVPGILAANEKKAVAPTKFPYLSDSAYPTVFWIMNGWNNFIGNMAAGAGACGAAYWFVPGWNSDHVEVSSEAHAHMKWSGYAGLQKNDDFRGSTPLKSFYKNYATSTMISFQTTGDAPDCLGVVKPGDTRTENVLKAVESMAPDPKEKEVDDDYYPHAKGGSRHATRCKPRDDGTYDCDGVKVCANKQEENCAATVLDHFTSSFHWAEFNYSAIWLRNQWYLVTNSVLTDVQGGGLTAITGGDYTHASVIKGYWALAKNTIFVGHTQPQDKSHPYSSDAGPFNQYSFEDSGLRCDWQNMKSPAASNWCLSQDEGVSIILSAHGVGQRLVNIYDGPSYEDSNAFLDITKTACPNTGSDIKGRCMYGTGVAVGVRKGEKDMCYLPNAAIAWKQPNGFFYPPAFHSTNLFFDNVEIRHYVVDPLFEAPKGAEDFGQGGTYLTANSGPNDVTKAYCTYSPDMFRNFTSIDRQTVLNDNDGSLTGLKNTLSINEDAVFSAPVETTECLSNVGLTSLLACAKTVPNPPTARTSPYDYVVTAIASGCSQNAPPVKDKDYGRCGDDLDTGGGGIRWSSRCTNEHCYGVPIYRQLLTSDERTRWSSYNCNDAANKDQAKCRWPFIRMAGQNMYQRHTLTLDGGRYYIDTSIPLGDNAQQQRSQRYEPFTADSGPSRDINVFEPGETYYVFFLYAKPTTKQTYQIFVGDGFDKSTIKPVRGKLATAPIMFDADGSAPPWYTVGDYKERVVTINVDFTKLNQDQKQKLLPQTRSNGLCGPKTFCDWESATSTKCVSNLVESGPKKDPLLVANPLLKKEADAVCQAWAVKDLDCPAEGCFGFSFTLKKETFKADGTGQRWRPNPDDFKADTFPAWATKFSPTDKVPDDKSGGQCYYAKDAPPVSGPCQPPP